MFVVLKSREIDDLRLCMAMFPLSQCQSSVGDVLTVSTVAAILFHIISFRMMHPLSVSVFFF